jgi:hypothetical protein
MALHLLGKPSTTWAAHSQTFLHWLFLKYGLVLFAWASIGGDPLTYLSCIAGIADVCHYVLLVCWNGIFPLSSNSTTTKKKKKKRKRKRDGISLTFFWPRLVLSINPMVSTSYVAGIAGMHPTPGPKGDYFDCTACSVSKRQIFTRSHSQGWQAPATSWELTWAVARTRHYHGAAWASSQHGGQIPRTSTAGVPGRKYIFSLA